MSKQKGFSLVEGLLVVLVLAVVGFGGYYVWSQNQEEELASSEANSEIAEPLDEENIAESEKVTKENISKFDSSDWTLIDIPTGQGIGGDAVNIKLADGWYLYNQDSSLLYGDDLDYKQGVRAKVEKTYGGRDGICCFFMLYEEKIRDLTYLQDWLDPKAMKTNDDKLYIKRYTEKVSDESEGIGPKPGSTIYHYTIKRDDAGSGSGIYATYTIEPGSKDNTEIVEEVLKTTQFN